MPARPGGRLDRIEDATKDIDFIFFQRRPAKETAQFRHQPSRLGRIMKTGGHENRLQVGVKALDFIKGRRWRTERRCQCCQCRRRLAKSRHAELVSHDLNSCPKVQRTEVRVTGNGHRLLAPLQFLIGQAAGFIAENDRHVAAGRLRQQRHGRPSHARGCRAKVAQSCRQGKRMHTTAKGFAQRRTMNRAGKYIGRSCGACFRNGIDGTQRRNKVQAAETHGLHRPRGGADIPGVTGAAKHHTNPVKQGLRRFVGWKCREQSGHSSLVHIKMRDYSNDSGGAVRCNTLRTYSARQVLYKAMHPALNIAVKAARRAGQIISRASLDVDLLKVTTKRQSDFVTEVDKAAEAAIIEVLREAYPNHAILAEESGASGGSQAEYQWIIDPLDGTTNFIHGFPQFAVSIALAHNGQVTQGVVYDPERNELFTASKGRGAFLNDRRIRVSKRIKLDDALIGTGFPFRELDNIDTYLAIFKELAGKTAGMRRPGAAALDLAWVACGRLDGFWEFGLSPWDMAAGTLLISEAGGLVSDLAGESSYLETGNLVAGTPKVFSPLLQLIQSHKTATLNR